MPKVQLDSDFWRDDFIHGLPPKGKLLFNYLITCPAANIAGIFQLPLHEIEIHTGIKSIEIMEFFEKWEKIGKVLYQEGWVCVKNRDKFNIQDNESIREGVLKIRLKVPLFTIEFMDNNTVPPPSPHPVSNSIVLNKIEYNSIELDLIELDLMSLWNEKFQRKIEKMTDARKTALRNRMKDEYFANNWKLAMEKALLSDFCMERCEKSKGHENWKFTVDFFLKPDTVIKIMEKKYDNKKQSAGVIYDINS